MTLVTSISFALSLWALSFYASRLLQADMQRVLGEQQFSTAAFIADSVNSELNDRLEALAAVAAGVTPAHMGNAAAAQRLLEDRPVLHTLFNGGVTMGTLDGTAIADVPRSTGRIGVNYISIDYVAAVLKDGKAVIGKPLMGATLKAPVVGMGVPILDAHGKVIGALFGVIRLDKRSFLDKIADRRVGKTVRYFVAAPQHGVNVTASDKSGTLARLPDPGVNPMMDRFAQGMEGTFVFVNPLGETVLVSVKAIPVAGWYAGLFIAVDEAFAPIHRMQQRMLQATMLLTLLAGGLTWWWMHRELSPLLRTVQRLIVLATTDQPQQALHITRQDEIGGLITGFNRLLLTLGEREAALRQRDSHLSSIVEAIPVQLWTFDGSNYTFINDRWFDFTGQDPAAGMTIALWTDALHPDDLAKATEDWNKHWASKSAHESRFRLRRHDGVYRIFFSKVVPVLNAQGVFVHFQGFALDITERKQTEILLQAVMDTIPFGVFAKDAQSRYLLLNKACETEWGLRAADLVGTDGSQLFDQDQVTLNFATDKLVFERGETLDFEETVWCAPRQQNRIGHTFKMPSFDANGQPLYLTGITVDVTERKQNEQSLVTARLEAERANQAKSNFLTCMSHELRTPLNSILGYAQLMHHDASLSSGQQEQVGEILIAGYHLLQLIKEILDLAKVEAGHMALFMEGVEVDGVVEECLQQIKALAAEQNITIAYTAQPGSAVQADPFRLRQVLLNLLSNAIKYNRTGGSVHIDVQDHDAQRLRIVVSDTGAGIAPERLPELFQPFSRLAAQNSAIDGIGIGLCISRRIAELMGGSLDVASKVDVGSRFWIELERSALEAPSATPFEEHDSTGAAVDARGPAAASDEPLHTVLYIDDNQSNLRLGMQMMSRHLNIQVMSAADPQTGIALALVHRPALIFLDINMPGMDGFEVLRVLQTEPSLVGVAVVAVSANAMAKDVARALAAGFNDYLIKPVDLAQFDAALTRLLGPRSTGPRV